RCRSHSVAALWLSPADLAPSRPPDAYPVHPGECIRVRIRRLSQQALRKKGCMADVAERSLRFRVVLLDPGPRPSRPVGQRADRRADLDGPGATGGMTPGRPPVKSDRSMVRPLTLTAAAAWSRALPVSERGGIFQHVRLSFAGCGGCPTGFRCRFRLPLFGR